MNLAYTVDVINNMGSNILVAVDKVGPFWRYEVIQTPCIL